MQTEMKRDIKSIILLLATQGMINLGEIQDPVSTELKINLEGAQIFIELLEVLEVKTRGNLTPEEERFLSDILGNIKKVYEKKLTAQEEED
jgi:hypothetical protein